MEICALKKNDEIEVQIERLGANGEGIATFGGKVIFVPFALPGEKVLVHIILDKKTFFIAKVVKIIEASKDRVNPPCEHFGKCGGCKLQHLKYEHQLEFKQNLVQNTLEKYAKIKKNVQKTEKSEFKLRYRNKFAFPVQDVGGEAVIGMYRKNSHTIIPVSDCLLQSERVKEIVAIIKEYIKENKLSAYNETTKKGLIKHIVMRESGESFILTIVVTDKKFNNFDSLIQKLKTKFNSFGLYKNVNNLNNNVIFGNLDIHIYGLEELEIQEFGIRYFVNNRSFMQVNDSIKTKAYNKILELVGSHENVIDAYSGAGLLSSIIAKKSKNVYGVEIVKEATQNAEKLKKINDLNNLTNINGDCAVEIPKLAEKLKGNFIVVVDPPRKGLDAKVVEAFLKAEPQKIVYLSCGPSTLARDLGLLAEKYEIEEIIPLDMFPQTANVETLVSLRLK